MTSALAVKVRRSEAARHFGAIAECHGWCLLAEVTATAFKEVMREAVGCDNRLAGGYIKLSLALPKDVADLVMVATAGAVAGLARHLENDVFGRLFGLDGRILLKWLLNGVVSKIRTSCTGWCDLSATGLRLGVPSTSS